MKKIKLSNGAIIYAHGEAKRFFMAGVHGEERAPVLALNTILQDNLEDVWILPCLNKEGYEGLNRFCNGKNLNAQFKEDTQIEFMKELMDIVSEEKPKLFVDMHEDSDAKNDYIWTHFNNKFNNQVEKFCATEDVGLIYQPEVLTIPQPEPNFYKFTSETWARKFSSAYTTETMQYSNFIRRLQMNKKYFNFFMGVKI